MASDFKSINPATGKIVATYARMNAEEVKAQLERTQQVQVDWRKTTFAERAEKMNTAAKILEENTREYALMMTKEMGKTLASAKAEVEKCAWVCRYYAEHAADFLADEIIETGASKSYVSFQPLGVLLAVMPWNYPFWQVFRFAAPTLMAGNGAVLKHASNVQGCAAAIAEVFQKAGFPKDLFANLAIGSDVVNEVIEHPIIQSITLTGSEGAGSAVAQQAGKNIKKTVLELGGSDAYIILKDAAIELAAEACKNGRLKNSGQSCIGAKRFIVVEEIYEEFLKIFKAKMEAAKTGDPMDESTDFGPMARLDLRDELHEQVQKSIAEGAKLLIGGEIPEGKGAYYPATILTNVGPNMTAFKEELFGPVAAVIRAKNEEEAIQLANQSDFGLGAAVFTQDLARGERIAREEIQAGSCFVNTLVSSDPRLPFGGIKRSGYGRELSHYGIKELVNVKTVSIA